MSIDLRKNGKINLRKEDIVSGKYKNLEFVAAWDKEDADVDISVILLKDGKTVTGDSDFVWAKNLNHPSGAVAHMRDKRTGLGDGDDETIKVSLDKMAPNYDEIQFVINLYDGLAKGQHLGNIGKVMCYLRNADTKEEIASFNCEDLLHGEESGVLASFKKDNSGNYDYDMNRNIVTGQTLETILLERGFELA